MASRDEMADAALALDGVQPILKMGMTGDEEITPDLCALMRAGVLSAIRVEDPSLALRGERGVSSFAYAFARPGPMTPTSARDSSSSITRSSFSSTTCVWASM